MPGNQAWRSSIETNTSSKSSSGTFPIRSRNDADIVTTSGWKLQLMRPSVAGLTNFQRPFSKAHIKGMGLLERQGNILLQRLESLFIMKTFDLDGRKDLRFQSLWAYTASSIVAAFTVRKRGSFHGVKYRMSKLKVEIKLHILFFSCNLHPH